jgi:hypothetical protein
MWWEIRDKTTEMSELQKKLKKCFKLEENRYVITHIKSRAKKLNVYMVVGMDVENQMDEPNKISIIKSG